MRPSFQGSAGSGLSGGYISGVEGIDAAIIDFDVITLNVESVAICHYSATIRKAEVSTLRDAVTPSPISPTTRVAPSIVRDPCDCNSLRISDDPQSAASAVFTRSGKLETYFYRLDFGATSAICCVVDQMGPLPALHAAIRLLGFAEVNLLAVLGVAGALDSDVALGDVVVAREINEFQANSKAESVDGGYEVRYSGRHWTLDFGIREALSNFEFSAKTYFDKWRAATRDHYRELGSPQGTDVDPPLIHIGSIASGNVVAASSAFVAEVKRIDRKFLAIDMEAAGVVAAAADRIHPLPCLAIRGISDRGDEKKATLDSERNEGWRRCSVRNAFVRPRQARYQPSRRLLPRSRAHNL